jgi:16S rRNA (cytosine967-C5)-methyltransferase
MNLRALAAMAIDQVTKGHSLAEVLPVILKKCHDSRDQRFIQAIAYGVCRWFYRLDTILQQLLTKPLKEKDHDMYCLLLVGLYQLIDMRIKEHAAVAETVAATKQFKKIWAKQLVNAVLRNFLRKRDELLTKADASLIGLYSYPEWMMTQLKLDWPLDWQSILMAGNEHPSFSLRVNQQHITRDAYLLKLPQSIRASIISETHSGIQLLNPLDVNELPGFAAGDISVQDGAAQLAAELMMLLPNQQVLDACAAPGGKTTHMLEIEPTVDVLAIDVDAKRMQMVRDNLMRLKLSAQCVVADAVDIQSVCNGKKFDRILLDAPCSGIGVIRRHPDIKLLRRATDIAKLAETQLRLLEALWGVLKPGGMLLYVTCSIFLDENVNVLKQFLARHSEIKEDKIVAEWGKECSIGRQILPGMHGMDGFYFARLRK